ncbi:MAG TPA: hypothetical protein VFV99_14165 [Kofleriaceae bacterium]|nr:hypothetical protein [Kofleriaceae bacterium]
MYAVFVVACATGGMNGGSGGDDVGEKMDAAVMPHYDSNVSSLPDASVKMDASIVVQDAFVPQPDAASGPFCMANSDCTNAGECCFSINGTGLCVPGTIVLGVCFPIN